MLGPAFVVLQRLVHFLELHSVTTLFDSLPNFALLFSSGDTSLVEVYFASTETIPTLQLTESDCYTLLALSTSRYHSGTTAARRLLF